MSVAFELPAGYRIERRERDTLIGGSDEVRARAAALAMAADEQDRRHRLML